MHSLFSSCVLKLNDTYINPDNDLYQYKAYVSDLLSYSSLGKKTWMQSFGWYKRNFQGNAII